MLKKSLAPARTTSYIYHHDVTPHIVELHHLSGPKKGLIRHKTDFCNCGVASLFVRTSKLRGLKLFCNQADARLAFIRQRKAAAYGLAPKIYSQQVESFYLESIIVGKGCRGKIAINYWLKKKRPRQLYGYVTRVAEICTTTKYFVSYYNFRQKLADNKDELRYRTGLLYYDDHCDNIGYINGKMVFIDFGCETISDE